MILYIQHIGIEGPETLGTFFEREGFQAQTVHLDQGGVLPEDLAGVDAVVCLGGPMNVDEDERYPFFKREKTFIQRIVAEGVPFLGLCLGSQLLARSCGAAVTAAPVPEIGWRTVQLTPQGEKDPFFAGLPRELEVFQWHGDTFAIPEAGALLALGADCPHQALRVGPRAYGLQFHVEITERSIREWTKAYIADPEERGRLSKALVTAYAQKKKVFEAAADRIYHNFLQIIRSR